MSKITIPDNSILLLEGGSLRGLFTAGVLDTFMENDCISGGGRSLGRGTERTELCVPPAGAGRQHQPALPPRQRGISAPRRRCAAAACLA